MPLAIVIADSSPPVVVAIVRDDVPFGWVPPEGCEAIPVGLLPSGWQMSDSVDKRPVPEAVTPWQFFTWLLRERGITPAQVEGMIASLPEPHQSQARIDVDRASEFRRSHPLVMQFFASLGAGQQEIDAAFREMASLG
jgi:hypothetical protein